MSSLHSVWNFLCRFKYWVIFGFAVLIIGFVDENSILNRSQRWQTIAELRREISDYESRFEAASRMIESLDKEPGKPEQLAREKSIQTIQMIQTIPIRLPKTVWPHEGVE